MKILIATGNEGKKKELLDAFGEAPFDFLSLRDFPPFSEPEETGKTFEENALLKAKHFADEFKIPALGEDSGLILDAAPEKFGLRTRREIDATNDEEWLAKFLEILKSMENHRATFFSALSFYDPFSGGTHSVLGQTSGQLLLAPQAPIEKGVPVSAVFLADGATKVYSALSKHEKNKISHRGKAAQAMSNFLKTLTK